MSNRLILLLFIFLIVNPVFSDTKLDQDGLIHHLAETSSKIKDVSARANFRISFSNLGFSFNANGDYYFKQPDRVKLELHGIPEFLVSRKDQLFSAVNVLAGLPDNVQHDYNVRMIDTRKVEGQTCYLMKLVPKTKRRVSKILLWADPVNFTIPRVALWYEDGSFVRMQRRYVAYENFYLVREMQTLYHFASPDIDANVMATFSHYQVNKGIPDTLFENGKSNS